MDFIDKEFLESQNLVFKKVLGQGSYGVVLLVSSLKYRQDFAVKRVHSKMFREPEAIAMMKSSSSCITQLYDYIMFKGYDYLVMEYCPYSLQDIIKREKLTEKMIKHYAEGIIRAVKVCHDMNICHGDIKPSNFLVDKYGRVKICDFGLARMIEDEEKSEFFFGTPLFLSPEIILKHPFDPKKADIWSLGATLFVLAAKAIRWSGDSLDEIKRNISNGFYRSHLIHSNKLRELISTCLELSPEKRPTCDELLTSNFFNSNPHIPTNFNQKSRSKILSKGKHVTSLTFARNYFTAIPGGSSL